MESESIDIFYQGHGIREIDHIEVLPSRTVAMVKVVLFDKHACEAGTHLFLEDHEQPLEDHLTMRELCGPAGIKLHLHRCRHVEVGVTFAGETVHHRFAPGTTVVRIKHWAAVNKFHMTEDQAGEHVLQITGTQDRPAPGMHVGTLASCPECRVRFDLVPDERINGSPMGESR